MPLWITPFHLPQGEPVWQVFCAGMLIAIGLTPALESVSRFIFVGRGTLVPVAPPEHLVVIGFYRFVRNPMYVGVMLALTGEAILFHSRGIVSELLCACVGFNLLIWLHEEPSLTRRYPVEYLLYKSRFRAGFPGTHPGTASDLTNRLMVPDIAIEASGNLYHSDSVQINGYARQSVPLKVGLFVAPGIKQTRIRSSPGELVDALEFSRGLLGRNGGERGTFSSTGRTA